MEPCEFFAATDLVVLDSDPEFADLDNPRGERVGYAAYVYAQDASGYRRRLYIGSNYMESQVLEPAQRQARALQARRAQGRLPVAFDRWEEARPAYGSPAYEAEGQWADLEWERLQAAEY